MAEGGGRAELPRGYALVPLQGAATSEQRTARFRRRARALPQAAGALSLSGAAIAPVARIASFQYARHSLSHCRSALLSL
jgi:hypothetical protein